MGLDLPLPDDAAADLDGHERARLAALVRPDDARRFLLGALVVRSVAAARLDVRPGEVVVDRTCPTCERHHGRPRVEGLPTLSVSHAGDLVAVAVGPGRVGVDVERLDPRTPVDDLAAQVLTPQEAADLAGLEEHERRRRFLVLWTEREAALKATGDGLRTEPRSVRVGGDPRTADVPGHPRLRLHHLDAPAPGHLAALATEEDAVVTTRVVQTLDQAH